MAEEKASRTDHLSTENAEKLGQRVSYCPFGCNLEELDEYGYCPHLKGFTNDRKKFEPVRVNQDTGETYVTGGKGGKDREDVVVGDVLVNPEFPQVKDGLMYMVRRWVSWRLYRGEKGQKPDLERTAGTQLVKRLDRLPVNAKEPEVEVV
jgi:hypothetical protein